MPIDFKIRGEKTQYDTIREAAKIFALSASQTYKYEYLQKKAKLTYSSLGKALKS